MTLTRPTSDEILYKVDAGHFIPRRSDDDLVLATISRDTQFREANTYCVRVDYQDKRMSEVTHVVINYYRFFDDAYAIWQQALEPGTRL